MNNGSRTPADSGSSDTPPSPGRLSRFVGRHALHKLSTVKRCRQCGRDPLGTAVGIRKTTEGVVGYAGVESCGRAWLCPVCNAKISARRAMEIGGALSWVSNTDRHAIWGSLTCRHTSSSNLSDLLDIQREAWRYVVSSREWRDAGVTATVQHQHVGCQNDCDQDHQHQGCPYDCDRKRDTVLLPQDGRVGYIRAAEITIGENGWHPHFHPVIIWQGSREDAAAFADLVVALWVEGVERAGGEARAVGGQQLKLVSGVEIFDALTGYVTKSTYEAASLALEIAWSQGKSGRNRAHSTASHWSLLAAIEQGLADESLRWFELEEATVGHRMVTWSRGLRSFAGIGLEVADETIAAEEVGTADDTVCFLSTDGWMAIRDRPELLALVLDVLEVSGWAACRAVLDEFGIDYFVLETAAEGTA